jgi:hypothetical protein
MHKTPISLFKAQVTISRRPHRWGMRSKCSSMKQTLEITSLYFFFTLTLIDRATTEDLHRQFEIQDGMRGERNDLERDCIIGLNSLIKQR